MNRKRRLAWMMVGFFTLMVGGGGLLIFTRPESDAISPANCAKIKNGMRIDEVEGLLGGPLRSIDGSGSVPGPPTTVTVGIWPGKRASILVYLHPNGLVIDTEYVPNETSFVDKLRMWLGW